MEDTSPAHVKTRPAWVNELLSIGTASFKRTVDERIERLLKKGAAEESFVMEVPIWVCGLSLPARFLPRMHKHLKTLAWARALHFALTPSAT